MEIHSERLLLQPMKHELRHILPTRRQRMSAWVLLLVYVPMVLLSSLHVHSLYEMSQVVDCNLCETSVHHQGHITASSQHHGECLSCRFMNTQLIVPDNQVQDYDNQCVCELEFSQATQPVCPAVACPTLRGPPVVL